MTTDEKLEIYLELQSQGYAPSDIAPKLDMSEKALRNLLRRKNYTCINGIYVLKDGTDIKSDKITKQNNTSTKAPTTKSYKSPPTNTKKYNIEKDIEYIKEMLLEIKEATSTGDNSDEVATTVDVNPITGNEISIGTLKHFSIRADNDTLNGFHELCKRYPNINKSYMFTLALKEFIDNHF